MHADGKVLIEGSQGITLDAKSSDLTMKAGSIKMTPPRVYRWTAAAVRWR